MKNPSTQEDCLYLHLSHRLSALNASRPVCSNACARYFSMTCASVPDKKGSCLTHLQSTDYYLQKRTRWTETEPRCQVPTAMRTRRPKGTDQPCEQLPPIRQISSRCHNRPSLRTRNTKQALVCISLAVTNIAVARCRQGGCKTLLLADRAS